MKNFEVTTTDGRKFWISRAMAVCAIVVVFDENEIPHILINMRGEGTPDYQYHWNIPCGYLDWDETTSEACSREILEECSIYIEPYMWKQFGEINDSPLSNRQNVTIRKIVFLNWEQYSTAFIDGISKNPNNDIGEENEVEEIELMPISEYNIKNHKWAFNHEEILFEIKNYIEKKEHESENDK